MLKPEIEDIGLVVLFQETERNAYGVTVITKEERGLLLDFDAKTARVVLERTFPKAITVSLASLSWPSKEQRLNVSNPFNSLISAYFSARSYRRLEVIDCVDRTTGKLVPIMAEIEHGHRGETLLRPVALMFTGEETNKYYPVATGGDWTTTRKEGNHG